MLRETRAKWLALATALVVVLLAALFAGLRNTVAPAAVARDGAAPQAAGIAPAGKGAIDRAKALAAFDRLNCGACHGFAGRGDGGLLDGVGARLNATAIRDWTLGEGEARGKLPGGIVRMKQRAANDPELAALIALLAQSR